MSRPSEMTILAGGWSASRVDLRKLPGTVIAVNDSAYYAPRWDICVSMDRIWAENRWALIERSTTRAIHLRRSTMKNVDPRGLKHVHLFENDHKATVLSDEHGTLHGTNSGFCALNLAYQMRPQRLFLVGFDMALGPKGERHWFPDYEWKNGGGSGAAKLSEWSAQFATAAQQLLAVNVKTRICGGTSAVKSWERIDRRELEKYFDDEKASEHDQRESSQWRPEALFHGSSL